MAYIPSECSVEEYEKVIYSSDAKHRLYIKHGDTIIGTNGDNNASPFASKLTWKRRILKNGSKTITLNNFISHELDLVLHDYIIENLAEEVEVKIGTYIDSVGDYVYVPLGIFKIQDNPKTDKNKITYKLRDFSVKFDFNYNGKPLMDANDGKATKFQVLQDICKEAGVVCNIKSFIGFNDVIGIYDNTITARTYIAYLAEQAGKMATINRQGELIFIDLNADINSIDFDTNGTVENALEREVLSLVIHGNSKQDTRSGKNLFINSGNYEEMGYTGSMLDVDNTLFGYPSLVTEIAWQGPFLNLKRIIEENNLQLGDTVTYSVYFKTNFVPTHDMWFTLYRATDNILRNYISASEIVPDKWYRFPFTFKIEETSLTATEARIETEYFDANDPYYFGNNRQNKIWFACPQFEIGGLTDFEPYGVSPSPEFPSEIETVKGIQNKFNKETATGGWLQGSTNTYYEEFLDVYGTSDYIEVEALTEYLIYLGKTSGIGSGGYCFYDTNKTYISGVDYGSDISFVVTKSPINAKYIRFTFQQSNIDETRLNKGTTIQTYTPYGSNYLVNKIENNNKLNPLKIIKGRLDNGVLGYDYDTSSLETTKESVTFTTTVAWRGVVSNYFEVINKDTLFIRSETSLSSYSRQISCYDENFNFIANASTKEDRDDYKSYTIPEGTNYIRIWFYLATAGTITINKIMVSTDNIEYQPFQESITTYDLQGNELVAIGDVRDELDIVTGTLTKRIGKVVLNGSENWEMIGTNVSGKNRFQTNDYANKVVSNFDGNQYLNALSNKFIPTTPNETYLCKTGIASVNQYFVFFNENVYDSLENWINWLSNNPVTVYYELAQPEIIQLGPTEIKTFEGTNHITLESELGTDFTLEYNVPKKVNNISPDIVEKFTAGDIYKVSKVLFETGAIKYENGTDDADTLYINANNPYIANQEQLNRILIPVNGFEINSFKTGKVLGNPLIDPSDLIKVEYDGIIYKTLAQYTLNFTGTMTSTYETTVEYEAKKSNVSSIGSSEWKKYVNTQIDNVNATITTKVGEVNSAVDDVKNSVGDVSERVAEAESKINTNNDNYTALESRTTTVEQSVKGWDYKFETVTTDINGINDKVDAVDNANKKIEKYIRFVDGKIVIGTSESDLSIEISNDKISFKTGDAESAYITNNELYITDNTILNKQTLGNDNTGKWETKTDSKGNLNTRWIG